MRQLFAGLFDDAALFPPGNAPMVEAVPAHDRHLQAWYGARASAVPVPRRPAG